MKASRLGRRPSGPSATGHWRAINQGVMGLITVTSGASTAQVSVVRGSDLSDSQADSAGSIPVTRSTTKHQVSGLRPTQASRPVAADRRVAQVVAGVGLAVGGHRHSVLSATALVG